MPSSSSPRPSGPNPATPDPLTPDPLTPSYLLFAQHGWADTNADIARWAQGLADEGATVIAPNLGFWRTWWRMAPLVDEVDRVASAWHARFPTVPKRIVGHSMGGLIWLEVLERHPDWWPTVARLSLVGSPVGGADLGRILDPFGWGIGMARDLGSNRRPLAEKIAQGVPTQIVTSNLDRGSDGTVPLQCSRFRHAQYVELVGIPHDALKRHSAVAQAVRQFWRTDGTQPDSKASQPNGLPRDLTRDWVQASGETVEDRQVHAVVAQLQAVPGMTDAHERDFERARPWAQLSSGLTLRIWVNPFGVHHVFLSDAAHRCRFAGFVGWIHTGGLYKTLRVLRDD
ncbi:MAG: lysophospholipase [Cyanobacteria bacterium P01_A01_bin.137]